MRIKIDDIYTVDLLCQAVYNVGLRVVSINVSYYFHYYFYVQNHLYFICLDAECGKGGFSAICSCQAACSLHHFQASPLGKGQGRIGLVRTQDIH